MIWNYYNEATVHHIGLIPLFLSDFSIASAQTQLDRNYAHGGGFQPMSGWKLRTEPANLFNARSELLYFGDRAMSILAATTLHAEESNEEYVAVFEYSWVCIMQQDGAFVVARMD